MSRQQRAESTTDQPNKSIGQKMPFEIDTPSGDSFAAKLLASLISPAEKLFGLEELNQIYRDYQNRDWPTEQEFCDRALALLDVDLDVRDEDLARIPADGALVAVGNHPFGGLEGVVLTSLLKSVRPDVKIVANFLLDRIPEMRQYLIPVDPYGNSSSAQKNIGPLRQAIEWLNNGKALGVFPAGDVSRISWTRPTVTDPKWSEIVSRIIRRTKAQVLPIYFHGRNSTAFQILSLIHPRVRTAMLPSQLLNKRNSMLKVRIGNPIPYRRLERFRTDKTLIEYVRMRTYLLARRRVQVPGTDLDSAASSTDRNGQDLKGTIEQKYFDEIAGLPVSSHLAQTGDMVACLATADQIPNILREIGRLREITFREVGEGTGREIDLDEFDRHYLHLFAWNTARNELVGAYRLGLTDSILQTIGMRGLYTRTLYNYKRKLLDQISPAIELGRSFVRAEYQRDYAPLHLLWRGLGQFLTEHRHYRMMFGPVSISSRYQTASMQLMVEFLKENNYSPRLARLVKPKRPLKDKHTEKWAKKVTRRLVGEIDEVSMLISDIEARPQGVPILLRHYLKLGGKLLAFNIDDQFSDVLDGLILVDLTRTPQRVLNRYLGREGTEQYLAHHARLTESRRTAVTANA